MTQTQDVTQIKLDRMRYTKDKTSSNLILLAIVLDCLYFVSIYQSDVGSYYYNWVIGTSVVYNLLFLLTAFLASEEVKTRKGGFTVTLLIIGAMQFVRMFYLPAKAHAASVEIAGVPTQVMTNGQYTYVMVCLALSGLCCIVAGITSYISSKKLADYMKTIDLNVERVD